MTPWNDKLQDLERNSPDAMILLAFMCTLQASEIPEILFFRMGRTRECWAWDGEIEYTHAPVNAPVFDIITCDARFRKSIQTLESSSLVYSKPGALGKRSFRIDLDLQEHMIKNAPYWEESQWTSLILVCHSFPGRFDEIGSVSDTFI